MMVVEGNLERSRFEWLDAAITYRHWATEVGEGSKTAAIAIAIAQTA